MYINSVSFKVIAFRYYAPTCAGVSSNLGSNSKTHFCITISFCDYVFISAIVMRCCPFVVLLNTETRNKLLGAMSGEYGG